MVLAIVNDVEEGRMEASDAIEAIETLTASGEDEHADHGHGFNDPHFWFDPLRVKLAVNDICRTPVGPRSGARRHLQRQCRRLQRSARRVARLDGGAGRHGAGEPPAARDFPRQPRLLREPLRVRGRGGNSIDHHRGRAIGSGPSGTIRWDRGVRRTGGVRRDDRERASWPNALATEAGAKLVRLYSGSLGTEGSGAETYIDMLRTNVERIVEALK